jgi:hypothetical protein
MTLKEIIQLVDQLSPEEKNELVAYLVQLPKQTPALHAGTMDIDALLPIFRDMRSEMGNEAFEEMLEDMNMDYIEPFDENEFDI